MVGKGINITQKEENIHQGFTKEKNMKSFQLKKETHLKDFFSKERNMKSFQLIVVFHGN